MTPLLTVPALLLLLTTTPAVAREYCTPVTNQDLTRMVAEGEDALFAEDTEAFDAVHGAILVRADCLAEVVDPKVWGRHALNRALVERGRGQDWKGWMDVALRAAPDLRDLLPSGDPVRAYQPDPVELAPGQVGSGARVWVDGLEVQGLPVGIGPRLVQVRPDGEPFQTRFVDEESRIAPALVGLVDFGSPEEPPARRPGRGLRVAGAVLAGVGAATITGTTLAHAADPGKPGLKTANLAGWVTFDVGAALLIAGVVRGRRKD